VQCTTLPTNIARSLIAFLPVFIPIVQKLRTVSLKRNRIDAKTANGGFRSIIG
jgi:hypothetical protein